MGRESQETATYNILAEINGLGETIKAKSSAPLEIIASCHNFTHSSYIIFGKKNVMLKCFKF